MANKIKIRRGQKTNLPLPNTELWELRYAHDTAELFIDDGTSNVLLATNKVATDMNTAVKTAIDSKVNTSDVATTATANKILKLDASAKLPANITGNADGNAATATKLQTARTINGVNFDGSANITINAVDSTPRIASTEKGAINGVATLDTAGKVPASQLPSYVDDVLEYANKASFPATGEASKIYVDLATNKCYRWGGSAYVYITSGAVDSVNGKTGVVTLSKSDVGLGNVANDAQVKKVASSTDNAIMRWDGATGDLPQNSLVTISDTGTVNIPTGQNYNINGVNLKDVTETLTNKTLTNPVINGVATGTAITTTGEADKLVKVTSTGSIFGLKKLIGSGATEISGYYQNTYASSGASLHKFTNVNTGQAATDGLDIGIVSDGTAEIRQRESLPINEYTNNTLRRTITGGGFHIFNGSPAPRTYVLGTVIPKVQIDGTDLPSSSLAITRNSADPAASCLFLGKSRGATYNSFAQVNDGDFLSAIYFTGADGTQMVNTGSISARVKGTPSAGNIPIEVSINVGSTAVITAKADGTTFSSDIISLTSIGAIVGSTTYEDTTKEIYIGDSIRKTSFRVNQREGSFKPIGATSTNSIAGARDFRIYTTGLGTGAASTDGSIMEYDGVNLNLLPKGYGRITIGSDVVGNTGMTATQAKLVISNTASSIILAKAYSATANQGGMLCLGKSRGTTTGTETTTTNGDNLGYIAFEGVGSGNTSVIGATIEGVQTGTSGATFVPSDLIFKTCTATTQSEAMRLRTDKTVQLSSLAGTGNRMVVADSTGNLSATDRFRVNAIPLINASRGPNVTLMSTYDISFHWNGDTQLIIDMKGSDGVLRKTILTLS